MAKMYVHGEDVRQKEKTCYVCNKLIADNEAFTMQLTRVIQYKHLDCHE